MIYFNAHKVLYCGKLSYKQSSSVVLGLVDLKYQTKANPLTSLFPISYPFPFSKATWLHLLFNHMTWKFTIIATGWNWQQLCTVQPSYRLPNKGSLCDEIQAHASTYKPVADTWSDLLGQQNTCEKCTTNDAVQKVSNVVLDFCKTSAEYHMAQNFDRGNIDEFVKVSTIRQYFPIKILHLATYY